MTLLSLEAIVLVLLTMHHGPLVHRKMELFTPEKTIYKNRINNFSCCGSRAEVINVIKNIPVSV